MSLYFVTRTLEDEPVLHVSWADTVPDALYKVQFVYGSYRIATHPWDVFGAHWRGSVESFREYVYELHVKSLMLVPERVIVYVNTLGVKL